jgi:proteasome lid subunit RPN8/RPN11
VTRWLTQPVTSLALRRDVWRDLHRAVGQGHRSQVEVCRLLIGTLASRRAVAAESIDCHNWSASGTRFSVPVSDIEGAQASARARGLVLLALVHTHPSGVARPSLADLDLPRTTGLLSIIAAIEDDVIRFACYAFFREQVRPVRVDFLAG